MIRLLSTDFDGTLVNHEGAPPVSPALFETFADLRSQGAVWAVNTGRTLDHILEGLREYGFPAAPDFIVTTERHVFKPRKDGGGWEDYGDWNQRCEEAHQELFSSARGLIEEIAAFVERETHGQLIYENAMPAGLIASSEKEMDFIAARIDQTRGAHPALHYQRNTMYLRFCHVDYSKGAALGELARLLGISRNEIFAAGDHYNDIPMLDGRHARWVACPDNSTETVKETVRNAGGYVAQAGYSEGVIEALRHFSRNPSARNPSDLGA
jgi:HAD superfamily hydrolase (TIGR01484 family)